MPPKTVPMQLGQVEKQADTATVATARIAAV